MKFYRNRQMGFTLVELVMVIVVLSILALGTSRYIITSTQSFVVSAERAKLIATARVAVEQVARQMRNALPNSVRIFASGRCMEYFPILVGSSTTEPILPASTSLGSSQFDLMTSVNNYAVIAAFSASELYDSSLPSPGVIAATSLNAGTNYKAIPLTGPHTFTRTSPTQRVYLVANPVRFCVTAEGNLMQYNGYGIEDTTPIVPSGANSVLVAEHLDIAGATSFVYTAGTLTNNALVQVNLAFSKGGEGVNMSHEVQIRNVP